MQSSCLVFILLLVLVAFLIQAVLIGTRWWGHATPPTDGKYSIARNVGLFGSQMPNVKDSDKKETGGKARLAQTLSTVALVLALLSLLLVICLTSHKRVPSCGVRNGATITTLLAFAVSISASIFDTRYIKSMTGISYGVAVPLHYVSSLMLLAGAVLLFCKMKGSPSTMMSAPLGSTALHG